MANSLFPKYRQRQLDGSAPVEYLTDDIVVIALDNTYVYDDAHEFVDDISGTAIVATSGVFTGKTVDTPTPGVADADDVTLVAVTGDDIEYLVIAKDTGSAATSPLMVFLETKTNASPIFITPVGDDVIITWSNGATRIFRL